MQRRAIRAAKSKARRRSALSGAEGWLPFQKIRQVCGGHFFLRRWSIAIAKSLCWMDPLGVSVRVDAAGNLRAFYPGVRSGAPRLMIGSHLDTVPDAGAYDGILGVVLAVSLLESLDGRRLPFGIEVVGFSEEEGVRFGVPFIGSRALVGRIDEELLGSEDASWNFCTEGNREISVLTRQKFLRFV